jgi:hypothetical protein
MNKAQLELLCNAGSDPNLERTLGIGMTNAPAPTPSM